MKRWLLSVAALFAAAAVLHADYVIIKVNLAVTRERRPLAYQQGIRGQAGQAGGMQQRQGVGPGQFGQGGMQQAQGFQGGGLGLQAAGLGGGAIGLQPGGIQLQPGQNQQGRNQQGLGQQFPGSGQGQRGQGEGARPRVRGEGGADDRAPVRVENEDPEGTPLIVKAVVEVKSGELKIYPLTPTVVGRTTTYTGGYYDTKHPWGRAKVPSPGIDPNIDSTFVHLETVAERYVKEREKTKAENNKAENLIALAKWELAHGITENVTQHGVAIDGIPTIMAELAQVDPKNRVVEAFRKVQGEMNQPHEQDDPASSWGNDRLGNFRAITSPHYKLYYADGVLEADATRRLVLLEENYRSFYYWFAVHGITLRVPTQRLIAVLVANPDIFEQKRRDVFDGIAAIDDGFYVRRDNLAVLAPTRIDPAYEALREINKIIRDKYGWDFQQLLQGKGRRKGIPNDFEWYRAQTLALVQKYMEVESERATTADVGTRQLLGSGQYVPRAIEVPQWIDFGLASFFSTPKGSLWPGVGTASAPYLKAFKDSEKTARSDQNIERDAVRALTSVISDKDFRSIKNGPEREKAVTKARTMAWALTYYIVHKKPEALLRYFDELRKVPRDMELDEDALKGVFAAAFGLYAKPNEIDENRLVNLANDWYAFMRFTPWEIPDTAIEQPRGRRGASTLRTEGSTN
jgi:hypothetical protein